MEPKDTLRTDLLEAQAQKAEMTRAFAVDGISSSWAARTELDARIARLALDLHRRSAIKAYERSLEKVERKERNFADILAMLRRPGHTDEQLKQCLWAMRVPLDATDPTCVILDRAITAIEDNEEAQQAAQELSRDDLADRRSPRGEYDAATPRVHGFLRVAV